MGWAKASRPPPCRAAAPASWPDREELAALRERAASAATLLAAGRHAPGNRELRRAMTGLARRGDWAAASDAALALAASLLRRGRPREAKAVLDASRTSCHRASHDDRSIALATLAGVAWTDLGRLDEAERVLSAAAAAVPAAEGAAVRVALALARCRFWRGRFPDADRALEGVPEAGLDPPTVVRLHGMRARIAVGRLDFSRAMTSAAEGVRAAETAGNAALVADARCAAGFVHLAVDDVASLRRDADGVHRGRRGRARSAPCVSGPAPADRAVPARGPAYGGAGGPAHPQSFRAYASAAHPATALRHGRRDDGDPPNPHPRSQLAMRRLPGLRL